MNNLIFKELIDDVSNSVSDSMVESSFLELFSCEHLLVIKSIRDSNFLVFLEKIKGFNPKCEMTFLCEKRDIAFFESNGISKGRLLFHDGRIHKTDVKNIDDSFLVTVDGILFCNYYDYKTVYVNVEDFCVELMKKNPRIVLYSYNFNKDTLNKYLDPVVHCNGIVLLERFFYWLYSREVK